MRKKPDLIKCNVRKYRHWKNRTRVSLSRGEAQTQITDALVKFERDYMGRGPEESKTFIMGNTVFVRLRGVLTQAKKQLA